MKKNLRRISLLLLMVITVLVVGCRAGASVKKVNTDSLPVRNQMAIYSIKIQKQLPSSHSFQGYWELREIVNYLTHTQNDRIVVFETFSNGVAFTYLGILFDISDVNCTMYFAKNHDSIRTANIDMHTCSLLKGRIDKFLEAKNKVIWKPNFILHPELHCSWSFVGIIDINNQNSIAIQCPLYVNHNRSDFNDSTLEYDEIEFIIATKLMLINFKDTYYKSCKHKYSDKYLCD